MEVLLLLLQLLLQAGELRLGLLVEGGIFSTARLLSYLYLYRYLPQVSYSLETPVHGAP